MIKKFIASAIRAGMNAGGGWLIAHGVLDQAGLMKIVDTADVLAGIVMIVLALAWSYVEKKFLINK